MSRRRKSIERPHCHSLESRLLLSLNVLTHHEDAYNDGANLAETVLAPANVLPADFGKQFTATLDGLAALAARQISPAESASP